VRPDSVFHAAVLAGLVIAVRVMISGVERPDAPPLTTPQKLRVRLLPALAAVAILTAGLVGSIALPAGLPLKVAATLAIVSGLVLAALARNGILAAAAIPATDHEFDPRYALQGVPGIVVAAIPADGQGMIEIRGESTGARPQRYRAASIDGTPLPSGIEVAVERVEDDVAFVEAWSVIEQRL
jgi:membrane protein implicated in regulation of membrane protease activity